MAPTKTQRNRPQQRQTPRRSTQRPNRAQIQAMEARSVATSSTPVETPRAGAAVSAPARGRAAARRQVNRVYTLSREAEYAYVRSDMRRLFIIAAGLFALMFVLLFIID